MSDEYSSSLHRASAEYCDFDLPPPDTKRWVTRRKAVIVNAVCTAGISLEESAYDTNYRWKNSSRGNVQSTPMECRVYASPGYKSIATTRPLG